MLEHLLMQLQFFINRKSAEFILSPLPASFSKTLFIMNIIITIIIAIVYFYQNLYAFVSLFTKKKKIAKAKTLHKYAYLICAHDEELVVGNLIESIYKQNYPKDLMKVFVVADNCKDKTAFVARSYNATVFERFSDMKGKSYAMDYAIKKLLNEYQDEKFDALFVFDADNLVSKDYTMHMNDLFDAGYKVATSYRESKNFADNWVSAGASMCFYRECVIVHHARMLFNVGTYISGTGYYIDYNIIKELGGWNYHTMTEDIEFSMDCANNGIQIGYCEDAIFYDEQPTTFKASCTQRLRWCKGTHQIFYKYELNRPERYDNNLGFTQAKFEMGVHVSPLPIITFAWSILYILLQGLYYATNNYSFASYFSEIASSVGWLLTSLFGIAFIHALIVTMKRHKQIEAPLYKQLLYCFTFPIYAATFLPLSVIALFKKVTWKKVEHNKTRKIDDMLLK